jgi:hypothetical protein
MDHRIVHKASSNHRYTCPIYLRDFHYRVHIATNAFADLYAHHDTAKARSSPGVLLLLRSLAYVEPSNVQRFLQSESQLASSCASKLPTAKTSHFRQTGSLGSMLQLRESESVAPSGPSYDAISSDAATSQSHTLQFPPYHQNLLTVHAQLVSG